MKTSAPLPKEYNVLIHMRSQRVEEITYARSKFDSIDPESPVTTFQGVVNVIMNGKYVVLPTSRESAIMVVPAEIEYVEIIATPFNPHY
jgi:hypothetical protein